MELNDYIKWLQMISKKYREYLGYSLRDMQNITGVDYRLIHAWENGKTKNAIHIFTYIQISPDNLRDTWVDIITSLKGVE